MSQAGYRHRPLNPATGEIRLLRVDPALREDGCICITIKHIFLNDEAEFTALSYTWGAESPNYNIHIRGAGSIGATFNVRENLYDFLQEIRKDDLEEWFWIDQICINQVDQEEKSQQVCRMAEIYTKAQRVLIWLSPSFENSDNLMDFIS